MEIWKRSKSDFERCLYEKELHRTEKGKKRALKRLYGLSKQGYNIVVNYLEENDYKSPEAVE